MVEGIAGVIVGISIAIAQTVVEISVLIVAASFRPWRYLLSHDFREKTNQRFQGQSIFVKGWFLFWGTLSVLASLVIVGAMLWFFFFLPPTKPEPNAKEKALQSIERSVIDHITKHKERNL